jgi:hypothetical protein
MKDYLEFLDWDQSLSNSQAYSFSPAARMQLAQYGTDVKFGGVL